MTGLPPNILQVKAMTLSSAGVIARDRAFTASCYFKIWVHLWRYLFICFGSPSCGPKR